MADGNAGSNDIPYKAINCVFLDSVAILKSSNYDRGEYSFGPWDVRKIKGHLLTIDEPYERGCKSKDGPVRGRMQGT